MLNVYWALSTCQAPVKSILVFCGTKLHKCSSLKITTFIISQFSGSEELGWLCWFLCYTFHKGDIKVSVLAGLCSFLEPLRMNLFPGSFRYLAESSSYGCRTEGLISLLAVKLWSPPRGCLHFLSCFPYGVLQQLWVEFLSCFNSLTSFLPHLSAVILLWGVSREISLLLRSHVNRLGHNLN